METHSKTAEKIKEYVDRLDSKVQDLGKDVSQFIDQAQKKYHQEIDELKVQSSLAKAEAKQGYEEQIKTLNRRSQELKAEAQSFMEQKITPLNAKKDQWKAKLSETAGKTEEKWEEVSGEMNALFETTKLAFHNFAETFKQNDKESA